MSVVSGAISLGISWLKTGAAGKWDKTITGNRGTGEGSILDKLQKETGQIYPELQALWQECEDTWGDYQYALPWSKGSTLETYKNAVITFYNAVVAQEEASSPLVRGMLGGITETIKKPIVLIGSVVVAVLLIVILAIKR